MDTRDLRGFLAVAESSSFTAAGRRLGISQPAVSQQIRRLEEELAAPLFYRHSRRVALTQAGDQLLPYARQILAKLEEARAAVSDFETMGRGRITIGAGGTICHHVLPPLLQEFSERFGRIEVQVLSGYSAQTVQRTVEGRVDLGIVILPITERALVAGEVGRDELVAIAPPGHPWSGLDRVRAEDFSEQRLIVYDRVSQTFRILERFLLESGVFPKLAMEIDDLEAVKRMVAEGLGVSAVASWTVKNEVADKRLVARPLAGGGLFRAWGLIRRAGETPSAALKSLLAICQARFPGLLS